MMKSKTFTWEQTLEKLFNAFFSNKVHKSFEKMILWASILGFTFHLLLIFAYKYEIFYLAIEPNLLKNPISAIYTPFTIILIYEIYLLVLYLPRSFTTSISKQFEIISLILIRRIFADIPKVDMNVNWFTSKTNTQLIYDLLGIVILYFLIYRFNKEKSKIPSKPKSDSINRFVLFKKTISVVLIILMIILSFWSFTNWSNGLIKNQITENINAVFYNDFFTLLILADVFILLLSFKYTERYTQIIRNTGFVISTILIRLSFGAEGLTNVLLIISSVLFGLTILYIYNMSTIQESNT